jgi:hypothetical protein
LVGWMQFSWLLHKKRRHPEKVMKAQGIKCKGG